MAEEESTQEAPAEKKSSNMLMIIIIVVLILIIILGALSFLLLSGTDEPVQQQAPQPQERSSSQARVPSASSQNDSRLLSQIGVLYPLDTFTVNLKSDSARRFLKATISLELDNSKLSIELDAKSPVIRDRVIRILTSKTLEEISSQRGKQKVSDQIIDTLNAMISDGRVKGIYFTEFVIQ